MPSQACSTRMEFGFFGRVRCGKTAIEEGHAAVHKNSFPQQRSARAARRVDLRRPRRPQSYGSTTLTGDERAPRQADSEPKDADRDETRRYLENWVGANTGRFANTTPDPWRPFAAFG